MDWCVCFNICVCLCAAFEFASALANKSRESIAITYCALFIGFNWHFKVNSFHFDCWLFWIGSLNGTVINISILRESCCVRESHWLVRPQNGKVNGFFVCVCLLVMTLNDKNGRCTIVFFFYSRPVGDHLPNVPVHSNSKRTHRQRMENLSCGQFRVNKSWYCDALIFQHLTSN